MFDGIFSSDRRRQLKRAVVTDASQLDEPLDVAALARGGWTVMGKPSQNLVAADLCGRSLQRERASTATS